jgi:hypothetical protein
VSELVVMIACEADADARVAKGFAERVLTNEIAWFEDLTTEARPKWRGVTANATHLRWASIGDVYFEARLPEVLGFFSGAPERGDAVNALKALRLAQHSAASVAVLMRDIDSNPERRVALEQAREEYKRVPLIGHKVSPPVTAVTGLPDRYREAWLLTAFVANNDKETGTLEAICAEIEGVHPTQESHRLRDGAGEARHAKGIWARLSNADESREESCWLETPLETLHQYGDGCGLHAYLEEVKVHLVPLVSGSTAPNA